MSENWATASAFFKCPVPKERMTVPDLGDIWVHGLTTGQKDEYEDKVVHFDRGSKETKLTNARAILLQMTVHDQHGNKLFAEKDIGKLAMVPARIADPILVIARRLSGMEVGEIEELVKNSQTAPDPGSGGSGSD